MLDAGILLNTLVARHDGSEGCLTILTNSDKVGLAFIVLCSFLSLAAVVTAIGLYLNAVIRRSRSPDTWHFLETDVDAYFLSLLLSDTLVALGGILNLRWIAEGKAFCGGFCSGQGGLEHISTPAVAFANLAIAIHTFFIIFARWKPPHTRIISITVLITQWTFVILLVLIPSLTNKPFLYKPSPVWCYISKSHIPLRLGASYFWSWFAAAVMLLVYSVLWAKLRRLVLENRMSRNVDIHVPGLDLEELGDRRAGNRENASTTEDNFWLRREAAKMLWYPFCYIVVIVPLSATRWTEFSDKPTHISFAAFAFAASLFKLGGFIDVILFAWTRPNLLLFGTGAELRQGASTLGRTLGRLRFASGTRSRGGESILVGMAYASPALSDEARQWVAMPAESGGHTQRHTQNPGDLSQQSDVNGVQVWSHYGSSGGEKSLPDLPVTESRTRLMSSSSDGDRHLLQERPLPPTPISAAHSSADSNVNNSASSSRSLDIDPADELQYFNPLVTPDSGRVRSSRSPPLSLASDSSSMQRSRVESFSPLSIDIPTPRISGVLEILSVAPLQREERLNDHPFRSDISSRTYTNAMSVPGPPSFPNSAEETLARMDEEEGSHSVQSVIYVEEGSTFIEDNRAAEGQASEGPHSESTLLSLSPLSPGSEERRRRLTAFQTRPDSALRVRTSGLTLMVEDTPFPVSDSVRTNTETPETTIHASILGDRQDSTSSQAASPKITQPSRKPQGPRPLPIDNPSSTAPPSPRQSGVGGARPRPSRPRIGIPPDAFRLSQSGSRTSSASPLTSSRRPPRTPRTRTPHSNSALDSIPEDSVLDIPPWAHPTAPVIPPPLPSTSHYLRPVVRPLSLQSRRSNSPISDREVNDDPSSREQATPSSTSTVRDCARSSTPQSFFEKAEPFKVD